MAMRIPATSHKARVLAAELALGSRGAQSNVPHRKLAGLSAAAANGEALGPRDRVILAIFADVVVEPMKAG